MDEVGTIVIPNTYGGVGDLAVLNRDIEIYADKYALILEVEIGDGQLVG